MFSVHPSGLNHHLPVHSSRGHPLFSFKMAAWCSGLVIYLLAGYCLAVVQTNSLLFDEIKSLRDELQPLVGNLSSRVDALERRLDLLDLRVNKLTIQLAKISKCEHPDHLSSKLDTQQLQLNKAVTGLNSQTSQLDDMSVKLDDQTLQLGNLTFRLENRESQMDTLTTRLDGLETHVDSFTSYAISERARQDLVVSKIVSQQGEIDLLDTKFNLVDQIMKPSTRDCSEMPHWVTSGVYTIRPDRSQPSVPAYCQEDADGGKMWTVFQRRHNIQPHQDFYRGSDAYKSGFGNPTGEFWLGLEVLHKLTANKDRPYELRIDLETFNGETSHAVYKDFQISSEDDGYRLLKASGYTGDAGDCLKYSVNRSFSTYDRGDTDNSSGLSCAVTKHGAWWYNGWCGDSNLNGVYLKEGSGNSTGITWETWKHLASLKKTEMMIRPR